MGQDEEDQMVRALLRAEAINLKAQIEVQKAERPWRIAALTVGFIIVLAGCGALMYAGLEVAGLLK
jgi:hypothetical protein